MTTADTAPSRQVLDEAPTRAVRLLKTLGTHLQLRATLAARGYSDDDHREGWRLLHDAAGFNPQTAAPGAALVAPLDESVRAAIVELDATDEPLLRILRASLGRRFPEQAAFVLDGVEAAQGAGAVIGVATILGRLDALANDPARKKTRADDRKALDLVAQRGYGPERLKELRALVKKAQSSPDTLPTTTTTATAPADDPARVAALGALHAWWKEWSEIARAVIRRRDHLILLGLARRAARKAAAAPAPAPV
ncbi:MAG: hypothetical protein JWM10_1019 [Myxococcaceae bacterium]|nr:hypothetical protein [Myxococcaceae bacterium]